MRLALSALGLLLLQSSFDHTQEVEATPQRYRLQGTVDVPPGARGQTCVVLDAALYAHAGTAIDDLRLYSAGHEVPFVRTESREAGQQEEPARVLNLGVHGKAIVFDLAMPARSYTAVALDLDARDFYATAHVSGLQTPGGAVTDLGRFAIFDLRSSGLSRSTTLPLQEASFPFLHVELVFQPAPEAATKEFPPTLVRGAAVPPSREAQTLYTISAATSDIGVQGRDSVAHITVPAHVPVERVRFTLQPGFARNFSRDVRISAHSDSTQDAAPETLTGTIQRVHLQPGGLGEEIRNDQLTVEALLGSNLRSDAVVDVTVQNGDDAPLPLQSVELEMRQRKLCFDAEPGATYTLRYANTVPLRSPVYDYTRLFQPSATAGVATFGSETPNPDFHSDTTTTRTYNDRHPELLWVSLLLVIAVLGTIALHNARRVTRERSK